MMMTTLAEVALITGFAIVGVAPAAFAQSYPQTGAYANELDPSGVADYSSIAPADTGGGSFGYNNALERDY
jgi:hypothetical protein